MPLRRPRFAGEAAELIERLRSLDAKAIARLMDLSPALAELNAARHSASRHRFTAKNSRPAVRAFDGDVYDGLGPFITFPHPKANAEFPIAGEGVLIELVQAPPEVVAALGG